MVKYAVSLFTLLSLVTFMGASTASAHSNKKAVKAVYIALYNDIVTQRDTYVEMIPDARGATRRNIGKRVETLKAMQETLEQRIEKNGW